MPLGLRPLGSAALASLLVAGGGITGTIAWTEPADTLAATGGNGMSGTIVVTEAADTAALAGSGVLPGTIAVTEAADSVALGGTGTANTTIIAKIAPFFTTDTITAAGFQLYRYVAGTLTADGSHVTTGISAIPSLTNGYAVALTPTLMTLDADGGYRGLIKWDSGGGSPFYVADEVYVPATQLDLTQAVPTANAAQTVGDALNAARAQGFGKWVLSGTTLTLYASNGSTVVRTFTLDSSSAPTTRT